MTIAELLKKARDTIGGDSAKLDAELLLAFCLGRNRSFLYAWPEKIPDASITQQFETLVSRRSAGEPIAYLTGTREFWSLTLECNASTLIPRPETEKLVEIALQLRRETARVLDLGTGTGAIALALASECSGWDILGADINTEAISLAQRNALRNGITTASFVQSNWFDAVSGCFDLIVSNPPYIAADDPHLTQGDVRFEPTRALIAERDGMAAIETIAQQAPQYLHKNGWLLIEHGWQQGVAARATLTAQGFSDITTWCDHGGRDRVTGGAWPGHAQPNNGITMQ